MKIDFNTLYIATLQRTGWPHKSLFEAYVWAPTRAEADILAAKGCPEGHEVSKMKAYGEFNRYERLELRINFYLASNLAKFIPSWLKKL